MDVNHLPGNDSTMRPRRDAVQNFPPIRIGNKKETKDFVSDTLSRLSVRHRKVCTMPDQLAEEQRLAAASEGRTKWKFWGPYLSERQWGTVREDYSENGNA